MSKINKSVLDYVNDLFKNENNSLVKDDGTVIGNIKCELLKRNGAEFIKKYDLQIDKLAYSKVYKHKEN